MEKFVTVYITAPNQKEAQKISHLILSEKLAGCINIIPYTESLYHWEGKIENHSEAVLIAKTRKSLVKKLIEFVKNHHSYKVPCITVLPIVDGNKDYFKWLSKETIRIKRIRRQ